MAKKVGNYKNDGQNIPPVSLLHTTTKKHEHHHWLCELLFIVVRFFNGSQGNSNTQGCIQNETIIFGENYLTGIWSQKGLLIMPNSRSGTCNQLKTMRLFLHHVSDSIKALPLKQLIFYEYIKWYMNTLWVESVGIHINNNILVRWKKQRLVFSF